MESLEQGRKLWGTEGFLVECAKGELGRVERVWVDKASQPSAVAIQTKDGKYGLLLAEHVLAVQRQQHWVVAPSDAPLLELEPSTGEDRRSGGSWKTTGALLDAAPQPVWTWPLSLPSLGLRRRTETTEEPPRWRTVALLYAGLALVVLLVMTLAFFLADVIAGAAY